MLSTTEENLIKMYKEGSFAGQKMLIKNMKEILVKVPSLTIAQLLVITEETTIEREREFLTSLNNKESNE